MQPEQTPPSVPPTPPVAPTPPQATSAPQPAVPVGQPALESKSGLRTTLMILDFLFFIPSMIAVAIYYSRYEQARMAGDVMKAKKSLRAMQLWGFIGMGLGILLVIAKFASGSN